MTSKAASLLFGACGIYSAFLYYGTLQEDVFKFVSEDDSKFKSAWFLQLIGMGIKLHHDILL